MFVEPPQRGREELPRRQLTDRLFLGVTPDQAAADAMIRRTHELSAQHRLRGRQIARAHFHASMHHIGDYLSLPQHVVAKACNVASTIVMPSFVVAFDRAVSFRGRPGNQPLVLVGNDGVAGLMLFQQALGPALEAAGLGRQMRRFTPHVTLLYGDSLAAEQAIEPVSWTVREFVLVHSLLGRSQHIVLARFPLRG